ncbi:unnamed protein product [Rhizophagus irregularis]|nr:unnamed protein product [Rhizophagus irregularis]
MKPMEKKNNQKKTGKIFFNYHMIHIGLIRQFKSNFPTFSVSVEDFVLQKITENIVGNWTEIEHKKKIKEAQIQRIEPPPKCKNITLPNPKLKKMKSIPPAPISNAALTEIEINDSDIQINDADIQFNNANIQINDTYV